MDEGPAGWAVALHEQVLSGVPAGTAVLEVGCGRGTFAAVAAGRGMTVSGTEPDPSLLEMARWALPDADLRSAAAEVLPWADAAFDLVVLVQVLDHAPDALAVLREAARVCAPGGRIRATVWGRPDECEYTAVGEALAPFLPGAPEGASPRRHRADSGLSGGAGPSRARTRASSLLAARSEPSPSLTDPTRLRRVAELAGLRVTDVAEVGSEFVYRDGVELTDAVLESGPGRRAVFRSTGARPVRRAVLSALDRFRDGEQYRLRNTFRVLDAAPA